MKVVRMFFSIIFSIIFTVVLTGGIFAYTATSFLGKENLIEIIDDIGIKEFIEPDIDLNFSGNFFEIPEVKELTENLIGEAIDYILNKGELPEITDADIEKIVNSNYYENVLGVKLSQEQKVTLSNDLREAYTVANETMAEELDVIRDELFEIEFLKIVLSDKFIPAIVIALVILAALIIICRWSLYRPLSWIGISMIIAGGLNVLLNVAISSEMLEETTDFIESNMMDNLVTRWLNNGVVILVIGIVLFISYFILKSKLGKNKEDKLLDSF